MTNPSQIPDFRRVFLSLGIGVIGIYALMVVLGLLYFRSEIRHQILQRDGIHLTSVANFLNNRQSDEEFHEWELFQLAIDTVAIEGIIAVRVFDNEGAYTRGVPSTLFPASLSPEDKYHLDSGAPVIRYFPEYPMNGLFNDFESEVAGTAPLIEVISPLGIAEESSLGFIQFWSDGFAIAEEFRHLDHKLTITGVLLIASGGIIFLVLFSYARRRLLRMASLLADQNRSLEQANVELAMAARTSAIGSVASHLFHGLKNPLAGLKTYLKVTSNDVEAVAIADRMQALIDESLSVIRDQDVSGSEHLTIEELSLEIKKRFQDLVAGENKNLIVEQSGEGYLGTRKAQLLLLVLRNLAENALAAIEDGEVVRITLKGAEQLLSVEVSDTGPGLPESVKTRLFEPVKSTKSGGAGIGLAISSAIARHIPAKLELKSSGPEGTIFLVSMSS